MSATIEDRHDLLRRVIQDPPRVHETATGVWKTDDACYQLIAAHLPLDGAHTLETGLGISTVLLGAWADSHVCIVPSQEQSDRLRDYLSRLDIPAPGLEIHVGFSDDVLPQLRLARLDLVLIDGGHGFPTPTIDWYYGSRALKRGGLVIVDDLQLPPVKDYLGSFLDTDPRWTRVAGTYKWAAYVRQSDDDLREEWSDQGFLGARRQPLVTTAKIRAHRVIQQVRRRA